MKALFVVAAFALFAAVLAADDEFILKPFKKECVWTVDMESKTLFEYSRTKYWVNKNFTRKTEYNYRGVIIGDTIYRPDLAVTKKVGDIDISHMNYWLYSSACMNYTELPMEDYNKDPVEIIFREYTEEKGYYVPEPQYYLLHDVSFTNKSKGKFEDGDEYDVYFNDDLDYEAVYVDTDGFIVGIIKRNDIPDQRTVYTFKYDNRAAPEDFVFNEKFYYNCSSNEIFIEPEVKSGIPMCAATATKAALAVVLISALIALF